MRAFSKDGSSKSILVDEKMSISEVCGMLADKNHTRLNSKLAVIEHMPELLMGECYKNNCKLAVIEHMPELLMGEYFKINCRISFVDWKNKSQCSVLIVNLMNLLERQMNI